MSLARARRLPFERGIGETCRFRSSANGHRDVVQFGIGAARLLDIAAAVASGNGISSLEAH